MSNNHNTRVHVFIGTKAQYIKTAPVIHELERRHIAYRLIDTGQHGGFSRSLRDELGIRPPDFMFGDGTDVATIGAALRWSLKVMRYLLSPRRLEAEVFQGGGVCLVHGDTPSTFLAALLARRAGLKVGHLEAGLRSFSYLSPFPEELIRVIVMKLSDLLFAPNPEAVANLRAMSLKGEIVLLDANTGVESMDLGDQVGKHGPPVITVHRVENLHRSGRLEQMLNVARRVADAEEGILFVVHPPTREAIVKNNLEDVLHHPYIDARPLMPHEEFVRHLRAARFVITDGGSIQEECGVIGVPTLLWRDRTERSDGLGANVVLSHFDEQIISSFLEDPSVYRTEASRPDTRPSRQIVDHLVAADLGHG